MTQFEKRFRKIATLATEIADLYKNDKGRQALAKAHLCQGVSSKKIWSRLNEFDDAIQQCIADFRHGPHHIKQLADPSYWFYSERYQKYAKKFCDPKEVVG